MPDIPRTPDVLLTALFQDGQGTGQITPQDMRDFIVSAMTNLTQTQQATSRTLTLSDRGTIIETTSATAITISVPTNAAVPIDIGTVILLFQLGAGLITVAAVTPATTTLRPSPSLIGRGRYTTIRLRKRAADEWIVES